MNELLWEIVGWFGYLQRSAVISQVLLIAGISAAWRLSAHQRWQVKANRSLRLLIGPIAVLLIAGLIGAFGGKTGLISYAGLCWLGWNSLSLLRKLLQRLIAAEQVRSLESRLLRPLYLVVAGLNLISQFDNPADLGVIKLGNLFGVAVTLNTLIGSLLVTYLLLVANKPPAAALAWLLKQLLGYTENSRKAVELIIRYVLVGIGVLAVSFQIGLNSTALLTIAGGLSVGLGFGVKEVFSNFISGIWLLFEGSVRPGEILVVGGDLCEVRKLGLRATLLWRGKDNAELLIPNQQFFTDQATSYTATDRMRRSQIRVGAAYHHDPEKVIAILEQSALGITKLLDYPEPKARLVNYGESSIEYSLSFWMEDPMSNAGIKSDLNRAIWNAFQREQIEIPFPQRVDYVREWPPAQTGDLQLNDQPPSDAREL